MTTILNGSINLKILVLQQQRLEHKLETWIASFIHEQLTELSLLSAEDLESLVRHIWEDIRHKKCMSL